MRNVFWIHVCLAICLCSFGAHSVSLKTRPVIGILTQDWFYEQDLNKGSQYIAASYVKYAESGGARVIPISYLWSHEQLRQAFELTDGLLLAGGMMDPVPHKVFRTEHNEIYKNTTAFLLNWAMNESNEGRPYPVLGICLGFEYLPYIVNGEQDIFDLYDAEDLRLPLEISIDPKTSRLLSHLSSETVETLRTEAVTINYHDLGILPKTFEDSQFLSEFFTVLSTNVDRKNKPFVSMIEGKHYPFYGLQWHPEKNAFEWCPREDLPHSATGVRATQEIADFFISEARRHSADDPAKDKRVDAFSIAHYTTTYTYDYSGFETTYLSDFDFPQLI
eukprot:GCRY01002923.1.p1 GENE.GCRY01002923.1~~GCRY01002923.1.p1  ORF type:complete len:375 (-),score=31.91 GCRY01002923.1:11-1009(-)